MAQSVERVLGKNEVPGSIPGLGSKMSRKLAIELVPSTSWNNNLRSLLGKQKWADLRKKVIGAWGNKCAICKTATKAVDCHEVWDFNEKDQTQNLIDIIPLCKKCHMVKHLGLSELIANRKGSNLDYLIFHYMKVNKCSREDFEKDKAEAYNLFEKRSQISWKLAVRGINLEV